MQHNDDKLVQLTLEGDHDAFATLVEKYQSQIHALAWRNCTPRTSGRDRCNAEKS
jgi:hypothetical protein